MSRSFGTPWTVARQAPLSTEFSRQDAGVGCHFLLQGIFLTQGSNPGLLHWQSFSLPLRHQGSPVRLSVQFSSVPQACQTELNCTPFPIRNQSVVPCPVLTVASWLAYRFLRRCQISQDRWSGIPNSLSGIRKMQKKKKQKPTHNEIPLHIY